jgi:DNA polymerase III epsilon subunit-like protein
MKILVVDTETTGLPPKQKLTPGNVHLFPHVVQLSFMFTETDSPKIEMFDYLIHSPVSVGESERIHQISDTMIKAQGFDFQDIYPILALRMAEADLVVGHNLEFDMLMLRAQCLRLTVPFYEPPCQYCTMRSGTDICNLRVPGRESPKFPKLVELYERLFQESPTELHNAKTDVLACYRCFSFLFLKKDVRPKIKNQIRSMSFGAGVDDTGGAGGLGEREGLPEQEAVKVGGHHA